MNLAIKYVAELTDVREVSLVGTADAAYWRQALQPEELVPAEREGRAQILVTSCESRFAGVGVRELSFCVRVERAGSRALQDAAYLVQAYNSSRLFAFCERAFFSTPYVHGDVRLATGPLPFVELRLRGDVVFRVEMRGEGRQTAGSDEREWEGPVFLPRRGRSAQADKLFFARIEGPTRTYAFAAGQDAVKIAPAEVGSVFRALIDSRFAVEEWEVREGATHLKSKTYARSAGLALLD